MGNHKLEVTNEERDLGIIMSSNLKPAKQCQQAYAKASRALGMIHRTVSFKTPSVLIRLYTSLVRPHLEYCISAWSPSFRLRNDLYCVEWGVKLYSLTRLVAILCKGQSAVGACTTQIHQNGSRNERFAIWRSSNWHKWSHGHLKKGDIVRICWKFSECIKDYHSLHSASFFTLSPVNNTRGHSATIQKNHCSLDIRRHFFYQRVVNRWNCLPQHVIHSASINIFKNGLHKTSGDSMGFFMDWLVRLALRPHMFWESSEQVRPHLISYLVS